MADRFLRRRIDGGGQIGAPRRNAGTMQNDELSRRVPTDEHRIAFKKGDATTRSRARPTGDYAADITLSNFNFSSGQSRDFCGLLKGGKGPTVRSSM